MVDGAPGPHGAAALLQPPHGAGVRLILSNQPGPALRPLPARVDLLPQ